MSHLLFQTKYKDEWEATCITRQNYAFKMNAVFEPLVLMPASTTLTRGKRVQMDNSSRLLFKCLPPCLPLTCRRATIYCQFLYGAWSQ